MIDTEQIVLIDAPIDRVWDFAQDIRAWAKLMPGLQNCDISDESHSRWSLKIGVGALVRTVQVSVNVQRWAGPDEVDFTFALDGDPVQGRGAYRANTCGPGQTQVRFAVQVAGTGPMAPMWEAMGRPLLPKLARGFADQFKLEAEQMAGAASPTPAAAVAARRFIFLRFFAWIRRVLAGTADAAR